MVVDMLPSLNLPPIPIVVSNMGSSLVSQVTNSPMISSRASRVTSNPMVSNSPMVRQQQGPYGQQGYQQPYGQQQSPYGAPGVTGSTMGMDQNVAAGLSYVAGWVTGLIFFLLEKQNRFVRFNALQSIMLSGAYIVFLIFISIVSGVLPFLGFLNGLATLGMFVIWVILMVNAFQGKYFKLPVIGDYAERYANQTV